MSNRVEFELADNAFDYILSAAEHVKQGTPRDLKYAILHLFAGVELLLKARLYAQDWKLIFANIQRADENALSSGDFKSVDFENACKRLNEERIVIEPKTIKHLDELRKIRNKVQHFQVAVDMNQVQSLLAIGLSFIVDFTKNQLSELLAPRSNVLDQIHEHLRDFEQFVAERLEVVKDGLDAAGVKIECPRCWQETLVIGDYENPECLFCGGTFDADEMAEFSESAKAERCPTCERETAAVRFVGGGDDMMWFCYGCGEDGPYSRCPHCDNLMWEEEGPCSSCMNEYMSKND